MSKHRENVFARTKSAHGRLARALGPSFYPQHLQILERRAVELNASRSIAARILLEIEDRAGLLRRELLSRLSRGALTPQPTPAHAY